MFIPVVSQNGKEGKGEIDFLPSESKPVEQIRTIFRRASPEIHFWVLADIQDLPRSFKHFTVAISR